MDTVSIEKWNQQKRDLQLPERIEISHVRELLSRLPNGMSFLTELIKWEEERLMLTKALLDRTTDEVVKELLESKAPKWQVDLEKRSHPDIRKVEADLSKVKLRLDGLKMDMETIKAKLDAVKKIANLEANDVFGQLRSEGVRRGR